RQQTDLFISNFATMPELSAWLDRQRTDTRLQDRWATIGDDLVAIVGIPLIANLVFELLLFPARRAVLRREPRSFLHRATAVFGFFSLRLLPILLFVGASLTLLDQNETQKLPRFVVLNVVYAITLTQLALTVIASLLMTETPALRLIPASTSQAIYVRAWF